MNEALNEKVKDKPFIVVTGLQGQCDPVKLAGFRYWWLKYVRGFDPSNHCAKCLVGDYSKRVSNSMPTGKFVMLDEYTDFKYIYLCGVSYRGYDNNFHLAMEIDPDAKPQSFMTYNGFMVVTNKVKRLPIPTLPDGWSGYGKEFTTCRNFQFAVEYMGNGMRIVQVGDQRPD